MNYIKPEDIKEYVSKNPTGIAGESKELSEMVNHFAQLIVQECADIARDVGFWTTPKDWALDKCNEVEQRIRHRFGVEDGPAECTNDIKIY